MKEDKRILIEIYNFMEIRERQYELNVKGVKHIWGDI